MKRLFFCGGFSKKGADINASEMGRTVLVHAVLDSTSDNITMVQFLLKKVQKP